MAILCKSDLPWGVFDYGCLLLALIFALIISATTSLGASIFAVIRSCLGVSLLYGLCYAGLRVNILYLSVHCDNWLHILLLGRDYIVLQS